MLIGQFLAFGNHLNRKVSESLALNWLLTWTV